MDNKDAIIAAQQEQITQLLERIRQLEDEIARLKKNSSNSSKPPSSDIVDPQPHRKKKRKRRFGGQNGHPKHSRPMFEADEVDQTIIHKLPAEEVRRLGLMKLNETESALQQIDLPEQLFNVIEHRVQLYVAPNGEIVKARLPKDIRKAGLFSPRMCVLLVGYWSILALGAEIVIRATTEITSVKQYDKVLEEYWSPALHLVSHFPPSYSARC